jgi:hypothetical protein
MLLRDPSYRDIPVIPLYPQVGVEHREVIQGLVDQLRHIQGLLSGTTS